MSAEQHNLRRIYELARQDGRYTPEAFLFVSETIGKTVEWLKAGVLTANDCGDSRGDGPTFHVSGRELLAGFEKLARERWGLMARHVLRQWGIRCTEDVGEIVFMMVEDESLGWKKRDCDRREDFAGGFDFDAAFGSL